MKKHIFLILAALICLSGLCCPVHAAETDAYCIRMNLIFSDYETTEHPASDYRVCSFMLQDKNGSYLTAKIDAESGAYIITGWAADKAQATQLHGGSSVSSPSLLEIRELPEGEYTLSMVDAPEAFARPSDTSLICSSTSASVSGQTLTMEDGYYSFSVVLSSPFKDPFVRERPRLLLIGSVALLLIISAVALFFVFISKGK